MEKKTFKSISFFTIALLIIMLPKLVNATPKSVIEENYKVAQGTIGGADDFISAAVGNPINQGGLEEASDTIASTLIVVGVVASMVVITALGIKFMTSSVEEKAKIKQTLIPFTVGCLLIVGGFTIWSIVMSLLQNLN